jgi:hypothetical protein
MCSRLRVHPPKRAGTSCCSSAPAWSTRQTRRAGVAIALLEAGAHSSGPRRPGRSGRRSNIRLSAIEAPPVAAGTSLPSRIRRTYVNPNGVRGRVHALRAERSRARRGRTAEREVVLALDERHELRTRKE